MHHLAAQHLALLRTLLAADGDADLRAHGPHQLQQCRVEARGLGAVEFEHRMDLAALADRQRHAARQPDLAEALATREMRISSQVSLDDEIPSLPGPAGQTLAYGKTALSADLDHRRETRVADMPDPRRQQDRLATGLANEE